MRLKPSVHQKKNCLFVWILTWPMTKTKVRSYGVNYTRHFDILRGVRSGNYYSHIIGLYYFLTHTAYTLIYLPAGVTIYT